MVVPSNASTVNYPPESSHVQGMPWWCSLQSRLAAAGRDPRHLQILALTVLLWHGVCNLGFATTPAVIATLFTQWLVQRLLLFGPLDLRSPLITALSLCLLLRVDDLALAGLAAALAMASKFTLRWNRQHVFNPSAFAIAVVVLCFDGAWVSPGQWGQSALLGLMAAGLGMLVLTRARRLDVMLTFLAAWSAALFARASWFGDPTAIAWHQLGNGAVMLFAFFMITDPRTTPNRRCDRMVFAIAVAIVGAWLSFDLYRPDALILALAACGPLYPFLDSRRSPPAPEESIPAHSGDSDEPSPRPHPTP
jgi:Na+-transporting NADH:ubiquinone oxidoreductase subunit NqrB